MNRLSALDALFLYLETPETPMHIGSLTVFGPATVCGPQLLELFRNHTVAQFDLLPSYRRRPKTMPLGIDHPVWVDEDNLDLDYHIRHVALPRPGSMEQLRNLVAQLHMVLMDRRRPLWQYYLIEGLEDGGFAVYAKVHHAQMDGVAGIGTLPFIYDFLPDKPLIDAPAARIPRAEPPDLPGLVSTALGDFLRQGIRVVGSLPAAGRTLARLAWHPGQDVRYLAAVLRDTPRTIFNTSISGERSFGTASISLSEAKQVAKARAATINDIVLSVCGGALRGYLSERGALPDAALTAAVPASLRRPEDSRLNNQVLFTFCKLATDVADPLRRLAAIRASSRETKGLFAEIKEVLTTDISVIGVPIIVTGLARLFGTTGAADLLPIPANVIISNVPGPRKPMFVAGVAATHYFPVSIAYHGCVLNITVQSYLDHLEFGVMADRDAVPDAQVIANLLIEEFEILKRANDALGRADAIETIEITPAAWSEEARSRPGAESPGASRPSMGGSRRRPGRRPGSSTSLAAPK